VAKIEIEDLAPGEAWIVEPGRSVYLACCDCRLIHRIRFTMKGGKIIMRWYRDDHATRTLRRRKDVVK
jgi:hypothetical protein